MVSLLVVLVLLLGLSGPLEAADAFWDAGDYTEWSEEQVEKMLKDSPWAITKTIARGAIITGVGRRGRVRVRRRVSPKTLTFSVRWQSARPVKQALYRFQEAQGKTPGRRAEQMLERAGPQYVIAVASLPGSVIQQTGTTELKLKRGGKLEIKDLGTIEASRVEIRRSGGSGSILFYFPRELEITPDHKQVEFVMKIGHATIKRKFKPREMTMGGELEL